MPVDGTKPLLTFRRPTPDRRAVGHQLRIPFPDNASRPEQAERVGPKFERLRRTLAAEVDPLTLRSDPLALAPETLLVFELTGSHVTFASAVGSIEGLDILAEEEGDFEEPYAAETDGFFYLGVPDQAALEQILSLWRRYQTGADITGPHRQWASLFACLHDIRRWGPRDRLNDFDRATILDMAAVQATVTVEIELTFYRNLETRALGRDAVRGRVAELGGRVIKAGFVPQIAYDALLVEIPAQAARDLADSLPGSLADQTDIFAIRPQSLYSGFEVETGDRVDRAPSQDLQDPILAVLDGVPVTGHPLLDQRVILEDPDDLSARAVGERVHGTAMASLAIWGDLSEGGSALPRTIIVRPLTFAPQGEPERFPRDSLIVDDLVRAIRGLVEPTVQGGPSHPSIVLINISLGDTNRPFFNRLSPWARAVDWLAYRYGLLFLISAGNVPELTVGSSPNADAYAALTGADRSRATLGGIRDAMAHRTLIAPAEAVNALTVGASHEDATTHPDSIGVDNHNPLPEGALPSPVSRNGPGFRKSVKPDILMPGGRLRGRTNMVAEPALLRFALANRFGGLQVAGPDGVTTAWSGATSAAAALASRSAHQIYDALEAAYGPAFTALDRAQRALVVKSLLVHRAKVPVDGRELVEEIFGPHEARFSHRRKANVLRLFGYGRPDVDESIACAHSRATIWGHGVLGEDDGLSFDLPIPTALFGNNTERRISATLAWFSPVEPGRRAYKAVRLQIEEPDGLAGIGIRPRAGQAGRTTSEAGSVFHRCWEGSVRKNAVGEMNMNLKISRRPDTASDLPDVIPFGLVATIESADAALPVYDQVRARLAVPLQPGVIVRA